MSNHQDDEVVFEAGDGAEQDEAVTQAKLKELRHKLKECQTERAEYLEGWQRAKADYINLKNSSDKSRAEIARFAEEGVLLRLIDLADTFELAFANRQAWEEVSEAWRKGVEYIYTQLGGILRDYGVQEINPLGEEFNPEQHHSIGTLATTKPTEDHHVLEVLKKGYIVGEKVIRPAQVKVGILEK